VKMDEPAQPRAELLTVVRSLQERIRLDAELGRPLSYLIQGQAGSTGTGTEIHQAEPVAGIEPVVAGGRTAPLEEVRTQLGDCQRCGLGRLRRHLVFGEGNPRAPLVFVGEAPGADEDAQGRPFVGRAGQLLTKIIEAMGLKRERVYICNILKCRPPGNRNPQSDEIAACEPFLIRQLEAIRPQVICALGTFAAHALLASEAPISVLRGRFHSYQGIDLMPTYHPAYLLRNPEAKKLVWADVQMIMKRLQGGI
jgi:uracil-DNA glycosylase family 4